MRPIPRKLQSLTSVLAITCACLMTGCDSTVDKKSSPPSETTIAERDEPSGQQSSPDPQSAETAVVIQGDLSEVDWRSLVGRTVTVDGDLVVVDTYDLARRGRVSVARDRLFVPTSHIDPNDTDASGTSFEGGTNVSAISAAQKFNDRAVLILDDESDDQNVFPPALFPGLGTAHPTVRLGTVVSGVSGVISEDRNRILLRLSKPLQWTPSERPQRPDVGSADITVASFNVLNFFTTIDDGTNNARGADTPSELTRQEAKIVSAITTLDADIIGLMELENNNEAEERIVTALNQKLGNEIYQGCGTPDGFREAPGGGDSIRVGIIYRKDRVAPEGKVTMIDDSAFFVARTPLVQSFRSVQGGAPLTLIVNHFKSKGSADEADEANKNKGDGQAAYNAARRSQALSICDYIDQQQQNNERYQALVIGDLNAYQQEDPIDALRARGLVDLHESADTSGTTDAMANYSYVYYGQCGSLDHAFATQPLAEKVTRVATWHINADEPRFLDYNEEFNPKSLFKPDPFRSSDHDPVIIGIKQ